MKIFVFALFLFLSSCSKSETPAENFPIVTPTESEHFVLVLYDGLQESICQSIIAKLESNYARILNDLNVAAKNKVTIKIWNDNTHYLNDMQNDIGIKYPGSTGYVYGANEVRILYNSNAAQTALHEFCHTVSLSVNSRFGNNPRWFWEAVAIYESGEFIDPKTISYLVNGNFPTISELNSDFNSGNNKIYQVGYLLSEYIIQTWNKNSFVNMIITSANLSQSLSITTQEFEEGWKQFVRNKYHI